jgi:hypothetical protein
MRRVKRRLFSLDLSKRNTQHRRLANATPHECPGGVENPQWAGPLSRSEDPADEGKSTSTRPHHPAISVPRYTRLQYIASVHSDDGSY